MKKTADLDSCQALLKRARQMTLEFPPFVRGMGPEAQYWETRPVKKPSADVITDFIQLLQDTKIAFLTILTDVNPRTEEVVKGLRNLSILHEHVKLHPAKERELRSNIRQLVYYAEQFDLPADERVSSIENKISMEPGRGVGDVEYFIFKAEIRRIARDLLAKKKSFTGKEYHDAFSRLFAQIRVEQVISLDTRKGGDLKEIIGMGESENAAYAEAQKKLPDGAKVEGGRIVQDMNKNDEEISAHSEEEARQILSEQTSKDANINEIHCVDAGRKGFIGIGKRKGKWKVQWVEPYKVSIKYLAPVEIIVQFVP